MLAALALAAALSATPQQFDLVCTGTETQHFYMHDQPDTQSSWSVRLSFDLAANQMRWADEGVGPLAGITPTTLNIEYSEDKLAGSLRSISVDRVTGTLHETLIDHRSALKRTADSQKAPFRPFPATKF